MQQVHPGPDGEPEFEPDQLYAEHCADRAAKCCTVRRAFGGAVHFAVHSAILCAEYSAKQLAECGTNAFPDDGTKRRAEHGPDIGADRTALPAR